MFRPVLSPAVVLAAAVALLFTGCAAKRVSQVDPDARAAIGYAATARYPGAPQQPTERVLVAAVNQPDARQIEILNLSQNAITTPTLWVNGSYLRQLATIGPQGTTTVRYPNLLQSGQPANDFARAGQQVTKVELQTGEGLFRVLGPAVRR